MPLDLKLLIIKIVTFTLFLVYTQNSKAETLELDVSNIKSKGQVCIALYKSSNAFYQNKGSTDCLTKNNDIEYHFAKVEKDQSTISKKIDVKEGIYAIKVFLDKNLNKKLDTKLLGLIKESVGYSNNPQSALDSPYFSEVKFKVSGSKKMEIRL